MTRQDMIRTLKNIKKMCSDVIKEYESTQQEEDREVFTLSPVQIYVKNHIVTDAFKDIVPDVSYPMYEYGKDSDGLACVPFEWIFKDFCLFCEENGIKYEFTKINFGRLLKTELGQYVPFHLRDKVLGRVKCVNKVSLRVYQFRWMPHTGNDSY